MKKMNIQQIEAKLLAKIAAGKNIPDFAAGDSVKVQVKVVEGERVRLQAFEGICIARSNKGVDSTFTLRKISYGEGVERVFPIYSPLVAGVEVTRRGTVRRSKLYYLRDRTGKAARIKEKLGAIETGAAEIPAAASA